MNHPRMQQAPAPDAAKKSSSSPTSCKALLAKLAGLGLFALAASSGIFAMASDAAQETKATAKAPGASGASKASNASPIYGVTIPEGYRQWQLIAPAIEAEPLNELRVVLGNAKAIEAYDKGTLPFPDGTVLTKLAWKHVQSPEFAPASVPGAATTVQVMVKDSRKYAATGGWGFGRFIDGKPADLAQHQTCFACHQALVKNHDYVFTRLAR